MARTKQPSLLRAKIVKTASELFFEKGFSKTTSSELCSKVGMGTGNLYEKIYTHSALGLNDRNPRSLR